MESWTFDTWVNLLSLTFGAAGVALAIIFYVRSVQKPKPLYSVHPFRVKIVDKSVMKASGIEVFHNGSAITDSNVTATIVVFWNDGRTPIRNNDILKPFTITLPESAEILDFSITRVTREVCGFRLVTG